MHGCHPVHRRGTNRLKRAGTGLLVSRLWLRIKFTAIGREKSAGNLSTAFHFFETFWELSSLDGDGLFDYSGVDFSFAAFQNLNLSSAFSFLRKGLFFVVIRLVDLFPP